ncbi:DUF2141 domain-containing protein [Parvularcula sp. ZS-1/3]|uniref:DUF2141 domain-containing protein n=1 Tax=Parvularcula mediterranea TaxID=2732508 RepID=A0A7Y3W689_9PROT|nr:DUF2141 domain-containing protein [Parvularcula mediterranea]NNU17273.1 DUF2141 domain-containing protein [Parvularcula mediterranea]
MFATAMLLLAPLTVIVDGVESDAGTFYVSVQTEETYMQPTGTAGSRTDAQPGTMTFEYDVPAGSYAVSVWHDDNGNDVFDRQANGFPEDGWALSGNGGWQYSDVEIIVPADGTTVRLEMTYPE